MKEPTRCVVQMVYTNQLNYYLYDPGDTYFQIWTETINIPMKEIYSAGTSYNVFVEKIKRKIGYGR